MKNNFYNAFLNNINSLNFKNKNSLIFSFSKYYIKLKRNIYKNELIEIV